MYQTAKDKTRQRNPTNNQKKRQDNAIQKATQVVPLDKTKRHNSRDRKRQQKTTQHNARQRGQDKTRQDTTRNDETRQDKTRPSRG
jgi:hypothetical protein